MAKIRSMVNKTQSKQTVSDSIGELAQLLLDSVEEEEGNSVFAEEPVSIEEFLYGSRYLNLSITLSQPQLEFIDNGSRIFGRPIYTEGVLQCGQGSGKDTCSVFLCLRLVYLLECLRSPQNYFKMGDGSYIDIVNVAPNAEAAKGIFFDTLVSYMDNSLWFRELLSSRKGLQRTTRMVEFPKRVRLMSANSDNESFQGYTPILIVLDEIDAFKAEVELQTNRSLRSKGAEGMYETAITLVQSRFTNIGKVLCLSWPRFKGSFIQKRFNQGILEPQTYVPRKPDDTPYATWDFNPARKKEDFESFYARDPLLARARYECDPGYAADAFFREISYVLNAFDAYEDDAGDIQWLGAKDIRSLDSMKKGLNYYVHVDLGLSEANAALAITHRGEGGNIIIDRIEVWQPSGGQEIDIEGIENFILNLHNSGYKIVHCTYDSFQSASSLQTLEKAGILAQRKSVDRSPESYHTLKDLIQQGKVDGYFDREVIIELLSLDILYNNKVEKRPGMLKDRADAVAGAVHNAVLGAGMTVMKEISDMSEIFAKEEIEEANDSIVDLVSGQVSMKMNKHGYIVTTDSCSKCNNINCLEFSLGNGRTNNPEEAAGMWCMYCDFRWFRDEDGEWTERSSELVGV